MRRARGWVVNDRYIVHTESFSAHLSVGDYLCWSDYAHAFDEARFFLTGDITCSLKFSGREAVPIRIEQCSINGRPCEFENGSTIASVRIPTGHSDAYAEGGRLVKCLLMSESLSYEFRARILMDDAYEPPCDAAWSGYAVTLTTGVGGCTGEVHGKTGTIKFVARKGVDGCLRIRRPDRARFGLVRFIRDGRDALGGKEFVGLSCSHRVHACDFTLYHCGFVFGLEHNGALTLLYVRLLERPWIAAPLLMNPTDDPAHEVCARDGSGVQMQIPDE